MPVRQSVTFEDPVNNTEAFYQLVEVRPRVIKHKLKVRPQVEGYEVSVGGGYTAPCQPGPLQADLYDAYRSEILHGRRSRAQFLDDYAIDCGFVAQRHQTPLPVGGSYVAPRASVGPSVTTRVTRAATTTQYAGGDDVLIPAPRRHALGDATINVSKKTVRTASPPPALLSTSTPTAPVLAPIKSKGFGRIHKTEKSSFSNQVDLIGKRADKYSAGSKASLYNVSLADGLEFIRSMLTGGSGFTLADAVQAAKSADIDPYGRKALFNSTMGDGWVGPTENWREKVRKWEQNELSQLEEEQNKRRIAAFHEWEERMGEAEVMESGRAERIKELQKEWAEAELKFREEAMDAERARQARLNEKSVKIEEIDVGEEAKRIKEQKEAERKAAMAKAEADRVAKEQRAAEEEKQKKEAERKKKEEEERKKIEEREAALKREAEERKRIDEEEARKKREEQERIEREKREEEERIKREEEERLRKEREEAERIKREEEERIRKEEEERLRLEEEERKREEEETAKKFGLSGFGGFGADPFAAEEEEEADTADESQNAGEEQPSRKSSVVSQPADDEGVELIADDEDPQHDYSFASHQDTIVEEEEPTETEDVDTTDKEEDSHHQSYAQDDDGGSLTALSGSIGDGHDDDSSWQETEVSSSTKMGTEVNKDGTVTEEEEVETIPSTGYSVTGGEMPSIEVSGEEDEDQPSSSYSKTTSSWGGEEEEESEDGTRTKKTTTTTTTTTTEETSSSRTLKQKASIDTHDHEIIIYNKDGIEITRVTHGDVIVGFDKVDEVVMVKNGLLTVSHESGECLVKIVDGEKHGTDRTEVNVFEFDGEVIVRSLVDVAHKYLVPKKTERKLSIHDIATAADDE